MDTDLLLNEITYKATRSSGPGGQHVNKTSTQIELYWSLEASEALSATEKERLRTTLANKLSKEGVLILRSDQTRSQGKNKALVTDRLLRLLKKSVLPPTQRKPVRLTAAARRRRLSDKKNLAEKKANRQKPTYGSGSSDD